MRIVARRNAKTKESASSLTSITGLLLLLTLLLAIPVVTMSALGISLAECMEKIQGIIHGNEGVLIQDPATPGAASVNDTKGILVSGGDDVRSENEGQIDFSEKDAGYFFVRYTGDLPNIRIQVKNDQGVYNHICPPDKQWHGFPIGGKPGTWEISILANDGNSHIYNLIFTATETFDFEEESPFLYSNSYVNFQADSPLADKARSLVKKTKNDRKAAEKIIRWVKWHVTYDYDKAARAVDGTMTAQEGLSDPDRVFASGDGICSDLAILSAAMLRSVGLPTKLAYGNEIRYGEKEEEFYHAWIYVYLDGKWVMYDPGYGPEAIVSHRIPGNSYYLSPNEIH